MRLPTLRQITGFAMIVNTFLPAIAVVALGLMIWSTATAIKRNTCATIHHVTQAMNDGQERDRYIAAGDQASRKAQTIANAQERAAFLAAREEARGRALAEFAERLESEPPLASGPCEAWDEMRMQMKRIVTHEIYGKTLERIESEIGVVEGKFKTVKSEVQKALPTIPPIKYSGIPGVDQAIWATNRLFRIVRDAFTIVGAALSKVGEALTEPFDTAGEHLYREYQTVDYKRAVTLEILDRYLSATAELFEKFAWFFVILAVWLILSYALWVYRRLTLGWALLCDREAV